MAESSHTPPDKISVIVYSGDFDKIHYALATGAAALAVGRQATLFFTMDACRALGAEQAWRAMPVGQGDAADGGAMDDGFQDRGVATFETLIQSCAEMGAVFMVCEMGLRARRLEGMKIRSDIDIQPGGLVTFLNDASKDGAILFI
ncbi:MAG: hypothetical protein VW268_14355 [Rhodospirillaceae bacterium]